MQNWDRGRSLFQGCCLGPGRLSDRRSAISCWVSDWVLALQSVFSYSLSGPPRPAFIHLPPICFSGRKLIDEMCFYWSITPPKSVSSTLPWGSALEALCRSGPAGFRLILSAPARRPGFIEERQTDSCVAQWDRMKFIRNNRERASWWHRKEWRNIKIMQTYRDKSMFLKKHMTSKGSKNSNLQDETLLWLRC